MLKQIHLLETLTPRTALTSSVALVGVITTACLIHLASQTPTPTTSQAQNTILPDTINSSQQGKPVSASSVSYRAKIVSSPSHKDRSNDQEVLLRVVATPRSECRGLTACGLGSIRARMRATNMAGAMAENCSR